MKLWPHLIDYQILNILWGVTHQFNQLEVTLNQLANVLRFFNWLPNRLSTWSDWL